MTQLALKQISEDPIKQENPFKKGRPRSEKSRSAVLRATNSLLAHSSVQELSIEAIARKAKVGKTTIYRWWPNKTAVVMEALSTQPEAQAPMPAVKSNAEGIILQLDKLIRLLQSKNGETIAQLFSEAQGDAKSQEIFEDSFLSPLIDAIEYSIEQGQKSKEFDSSLNTRVAVDMLCGPIFFRLMAHPSDFNDEFRETYPARAVDMLRA